MLDSPLISQLQASALGPRDPYWNCPKTVRDAADAWNNFDGYQLLFEVPRLTLRMFYLLVAEAVKDGPEPGPATDNV